LPAKAVRILTILVAWEIWKERNTRIFDRHHNTLEALIGKIKEVARLWCVAGAKKKLCEIISTSISWGLASFLSLLFFFPFGDCFVQCLFPSISIQVRQSSCRPFQKKTLDIYKTIFFWTNGNRQCQILY
jgi:hypothetical protein